MTIQIKLFGDLRKRVQKEDVIDSFSIILTIDDPQVETVSDILRTFTLEESEVSHIFVNGKYSGLRKRVKNDDLVALFPRNMGLLYKWYFNREEEE